MLDEHLKSPITQQRLRSGVAAGHIDGFAYWLHRHGYEPVTIDGVLRSLAGWTDWMRQAGFAAQGLLAGFDACKAELETGCRVRYGRGPTRKSLASAALFIRFLREEGVLPPLTVPPSAADLWPVLGAFRSWMRQHRGLTETTLDVYQAILAELLATCGSDPHLYTVESLRGFVLERARRHGLSRAKKSLSRFVPYCAFSAPRGSVRQECSTRSLASPPGSSQRFPGSWWLRTWSG